ncbi:heterokaryon incompatibility protein-domain-containing protein, partial [Podospora appendiculata]
LLDCVANHTRCNSRVTSFLPTRVLDLAAYGDSDGPSLDVVLRETFDIANGPSSRYVALSHCWGDLVPGCQTTAETIHERKTRISWESLHRTFQDAAAFTRRLGLRYLWIDMMCIIQGSDDDWLRESATMSDVYGSVYLTLAADHAQDGKLRALCADSSSYSPSLNARTWFLHIFDFDGINYKESQAWLARRPGQVLPLLTRAWAYQERMISPRVLHFTHDEPAWECAETSDCECGRLNQGFLDHCNITKHSIRNATPDLWARIVQEYSALNLTLDRDKLPALSAIARGFKKHYHPRGHYLAGLWSEHLARHLIWSVHFPFQTGVPRSWLRHRPRPQSWCTPTWSWVPVNAEVMWIIKGSDVASLITINSAKCEYEDDRSPFGAVTGGEIGVQGRCLTARISVDQHRYIPVPGFVICSEEMKSILFLPDIDLGPLSEFGRPVDWVSNECLLLAGCLSDPRTDFRNRSVLICICLRPAGNGGMQGLVPLAALWTPTTKL